MNHVEIKSGKDILAPPARLAEAIFAICMLLLLAFFVDHQMANTGYFTEKFGALEMMCLYLPLLFGISAPAIRAWTGRHNPARPFEAATSLLLALGSLGLVIVFPFDYTHLADILPGFVRFLLAWVTDDVARIVLIFQVLIGPITALLTLRKYFAFRQQEPQTYLRQRTS